jgi:hypothetical protein
LAGTATSRSTSCGFVGDDRAGGSRGPAIRRQCVPRARLSMS